MEVDFLNILSKVGEGVSWTLQYVIQWIASLGINLTLFQSKILSFLIILIFIYLILQIVTIGKKLVKYSIIGVLAFLGISVLSSIFIG